MLIVCPTCESRYDIAADSIGRSGRAVRCSRCRTEWRIMPEGAGALPFDDETMPDPKMAPEAAAETGGDGGAGEIVDAEALEEGLAPPPTAPPARERATARKPLRGRHAASNRKPVAWAKIGIATGLACIVLLLAGKAAVVRVFPQTASLYARIGLPVNVRGLAFESVRTSLLVEEGGQVLIVEGVIRSQSATPMPVPRLRISLRDEKGVEIYNWNAVVTREPLLPGQSVPFATRVAAPPAEAKSVAVRFLLRRDMVVATR